MRRMYSENQLKEVVNKGIESGEIPSGGKLYRHQITMSCSGASGSNNFKVDIRNWMLDLDI